MISRDHNEQDETSESKDNDGNEPQIVSSTTSDDSDIHHLDENNDNDNQYDNDTSESLSTSMSLSPFPCDPYESYDWEC